MIVTPLIERLRDLARGIASGEPDVPRWIFLVGGPGNGKSETVEDFLRHLDAALGSSGELIDVLSTKFTPNPLLERRVEIHARNLPGTPRFSGIDRMIVVQDATATNEAGGNAAKQLADDALDLFTAQTPPLFLACVNRGLLARAVTEAVEYDPDNPATALLTAVLKATGLGRTVLAKDQPSCWPLQDYPNVVCWPMDLESLLISAGAAPSPMDQIFAQAAEAAAWETTGVCADCDARAACPFRQNAAWIREPSSWEALRKILRHGELRSGQRWNFRDGFSLAANLLVGDSDDFRKHSHPCRWVHERVKSVGGDPPSAVASVHDLVRRLYPHALFPVEPLHEPAERLATLDAVGAGGHTVTNALLRAVARVPSTFESPIRQLLARDLTALDPARETPRSRTHPLAAIELEYSQAVAQGNDSAGTGALGAAETRLLECIAAAEEEWDLLQRSSNEAAQVVQLLRRYGSFLAKRSIGVRRGYHADEDMLTEYASTIHNLQRLVLLMPQVQLLMGAAGFQFNLVESYGQPRSGTDAWQVKLQAGKVPLQPRAAPTGLDPNRPNHDVPSFLISGYMVPITFAFFRALRLRADGCMNSSLPASVRASLDRVRHMHAGRLCRDRDEVMSGTTQVIITGRMGLQIVDQTSPPQLAQLPTTHGES